MRSKTSFFNKTLFLKSVARFWPVWGSYFVIWLIILPVVLLELLPPQEQLTATMFTPNCWAT